MLSPNFFQTHFLTVLPRSPFLFVPKAQYPTVLQEWINYCCFMWIPEMDQTYYPVEPNSRGLSRWAELFPLLLSPSGHHGLAWPLNYMQIYPPWQAYVREQGDLVRHWRIYMFQGTVSLACPWVQCKEKKTNLTPSLGFMSPHPTPLPNVTSASQAN